MTRRTLGSVLGAGAALTLTAAAFAQEVNYDFVNIGTLGGSSSQAFGINDHGVVVGWADRTDHARHAFAWYGDVMTDLGVLGGGWSQARDVNDRGVIVGLSASDSGEPHAFVYMKGGMYDLNDLLAYETPWIDDATECEAPLRVLFEANAINDAGVIVGCGYVWQDDAAYAYMLTPLSETRLQNEPRLYSYTNLGRLPDGWNCVATDVNGSELVVGYSGDLGFIWMEGRMAELEPEFACSRATAINETGDVAGWVQDDLLTAVVWSVDHGRVALKTPAGWESAALDVNDAGLAVGWCYDLGSPSGWFEATAWLDGVPLELNRFVPAPVSLGLRASIHLESAEAVDQTGRIAGYGRLLSTGDHRAFVLLPSTRD